MSKCHHLEFISMLRLPETSYIWLPETGFLRLHHIIGDLKRIPPIFPLIPVKKLLGGMVFELGASLDLLNLELMHSGELKT